MPIYSYRCSQNHEFDIFFKTFSAAGPHENATPCDCGEWADRVQEQTLEPHFYGDPSAWSKPSPTKRDSTKTVSRITGNQHSSS